MQARTNIKIASIIFSFLILISLIIYGCGGGGGGGILSDLVSTTPQIEVPVKINLEFTQASYLKNGASQKTPVNLAKIILIFWHLSPVTGEVSAEQFDPTLSPSAYYGKKMRNGDYLMTFGGFADFNYSLHSGEVKVLAGNSYTLFAIALDDQNQPQYCGLKGKINVLPGTVNDSGTTNLYQGNSFATTQLAEAGIDYGFNQSSVLGTSDKVTLHQPQFIALLATLPEQSLYPADSLDLSSTRVIGVFDDYGTVEIMNFNWSVKSGGGSIANNLYTAPDSPGTVVLTLSADLAGTICSLDLTLHVLAPVPPSGNWRLAYNLLSGPSSEICLSSSDGLQQTQLTSNSWIDGFPSFSPDGNKLIFQSNRNLDGQIFKMYIDGTLVTALTSGSDDGQPVYSPDGSKIAFVRKTAGIGEIFLMDSDGGNQVNLTGNPADDEYPGFSTDGQKLVFSSNRDGNNEIYLMRNDGSAVTRLTDNSASEIEPRFSVDGKIVFVSNRSGNNEIYLMHGDGTQLTRLTNNAADDRNPSFSPDGTLVAFTSDRSGADNIFIMHSDGTSPQRFISSSSAGSSPVFGTIGQPFLSYISLSSTSETVFPDAVIDLSQITVSAHYSNGSSATASGISYTLSGSGQLSGSTYTATAVSGTAEITFISTDGDITRTAPFMINIVQTPLNLTVTLPKTTLLPAETLSLPASGEVVYDSGRTIEAGLSWAVKAGPGSLAGLIYTAAAYPCTAEITAACVTDTITLTRNFVLTVSAWPVHLLTVNLIPVEAVTAGAQWSLDSGNTWKSSGTTAEIAETSTYEISFKNITGYATPANLLKTMGNSDTVETVNYLPVYRVLTVNLIPGSAIAAGAQWSLDSGTTWRNSGATAEIQQASSYEITFKPAANFNTPPVITGVMSGSDEVKTGDYAAIYHILTVNLSTAGAVSAGAQWSLDSGTTWKNSGSTLEIQQGTSYEITFKQIANFNTPSAITGAIASDEVKTGDYAAIYHVLTVNLSPVGAVTAGAQWSADSGTTWKNTGATVEIQQASSYEITFKTVPNFNPPQSITGAMSGSDEIKTGDYSAILHVLTINLSPAGAVAAGSQWSSDGGATWKNTGTTIEIQQGSSYTIECKTLSNWTRPGVYSAIMPGADSIEIRSYSAIYGASWSMAVAAAPWDSRGAHTSLNYNGKMWVIGGGGTSDKNDVWSSTDAISWVQIATSSDWSPRCAHASVVFNNKMWVLGGWESGTTAKNDVWYSANGSSWTQAATAGWSARWGHSCLVYQGKMWVIGGYDGSLNHNDVWCSVDGASWDLVTASAGFSARNNHSSIVYDNKMWVIGGSGSGNLNDVWCSTDGKSWTLVTSGAAWTPRWGQAGFAFDNKLWICGGYATSGLNDIWYSIDGASWTQTTAAAEWSARQDLPCIVFYDRTWVIGGSNGSAVTKDVWYSETTALDFPVNLPLAQKSQTIEVNSILTLPSTAEIQYNDGSFLVQNISWSNPSLKGTLSGNSYKAPGTTDTIELQASYTENLVTLNTTMEIKVVSQGSLWHQAAATAEFPARSDHASLAYDSKMWVIGGNDNEYKNDVWYSTDGANWTQKQTTNDFSARSNHSCLVFQNKMWVIGGSYGAGCFYNDVWCSEDGADWTLTSESAAFPARGSHSSLVFDNKMWVIGGQDYSSPMKDIWFSADGINWSQAADPPFTARFGHSSIVYDNKMWVVGGKDINGCLHDAWYSTDGENWTCATTSANFSARNKHSSMIYDNKMWVIGGSSSAGMPASPSGPVSMDMSGNSSNNEAWYSTDGVNWIQATANADFSARDCHASIVYNSKMWVIGGKDINGYLNDVWYSGNGTAMVTPVNLALSTREATIELNTSYTLPSTTEVYYNDGSCTVHDIIWSKVSGSGSYASNVYTASETTGEAVLSATYSTLTSTMEIRVVGQGAVWHRAIESADFSPRVSHSSMVFQNEMWVIGGQIAEDPYLVNDVYSSADGKVWNLHTPGGSIFSERYCHTSLVYDDKMWVIGGAWDGYLNDVWCSPDGASWTQVPPAGDGFSARGSHSSLVYDNKMWVIGGIGDGYLNDVWYSTDGANWVQLQPVGNGFSARSSHSSLVYDNKMWVIGGYCYGEGGAYYNDVWYSTDGANWVQATDNAAFSPRCAQTSFVYDDKMWVIGGCDESNCFNDIWYSTDGVNWVQATASADFTPRSLHTGFVYENKMWLIAGQDDNGDYLQDVWYSDSGTVEVTPLYMTLNLVTLETYAGCTSNLASISATIYDSNGTSSETGSLSFAAEVGNVTTGIYTAPNPAVDTIEVSYTGNGKTITAHLLVRQLCSDWIQATAGAAFSKRQAHSSLVFNNKMWVIGGTLMVDGMVSSPKNDVWSSTDGTAWTEVKTNYPGAGFSARGYHSSVVFNNLMWLIGGMEQYNYKKNDVWYSADGCTWTSATATAGFSARAFHASLVFDNKIWVIGGNDGEIDKNDVWYSADGINWTQATGNADFSARSYHSSIVYDNRMWVIGGYSGETGDLHDVWYSTNGINWTQATASAAWSARSCLASLVYDNNIWEVAGVTDGAQKNDVWHSINGVDWVQATAYAAFPPRDTHTSLVFDNKMWVIAGDSSGEKNDVWYSELSGAAKTPVNLALSTHEATIEVSTSYTLPSTTEVYYNDGTSVVRNITWTKTSGSGSLVGNLYTAPGAVEEAVFTTTHTEGAVTLNGTIEINVVVYTLTVNLTPDLAVTQGAQWRLAGEGSWRNSGTSAPVSGGFPATIECKATTNWNTPATKEITMPLGDSVESMAFSAIYGAVYTCETSATGSYAVDHQSLVYNNKMWVIAGFDNSSYTNNVWSSSDGKTWTLVTSNAAFSKRISHTSLVFDNKMWVIGGVTAPNNDASNDVWYSVDGATWTQATASAAFAARSGHTSVVFDNKMWVIGGYYLSYHNDAWYTVDGITWTKATTSAKLIRTNHQSLVYNNKMWVIGGSNDSAVWNDVYYSTDGVTWTQATASASFSPRCQHSSIVLDNKMWIIGGIADTWSGPYKNDIWFSTDGSNWTEATPTAAFPIRAGHTSLAFNNKIWVICGGGTTGNNRKNDAWSSYTNGEVTPIYMETSPKTLEVQASTGYDCGVNLHKYVFYSSNSSSEVSAVSYAAVRGSFAVNTYNAPGTPGVDTIEITYIEGGKTITTHVSVTNSP
ncbi:MAG: Ig-like domain-containing protein [Candidatus Wallbacteria bacterium]|nr:Ig-like domain-containing protein [Candidatus Wallbacteria bacterium]